MLSNWLKRTKIFRARKDTQARDNNVIECSVCNKWFHYKCTLLPIYYLIHLEKSDSDYKCYTCVHDNNKDSYPDRYDELSGIICSFTINPDTNTSNSSTSTQNSSAQQDTTNTNSTTQIAATTTSTPLNGEGPVSTNNVTDQITVDVVGPW